MSVLTPEAAGLDQPHARASVAVLAACELARHNGVPTRTAYALMNAVDPGTARSFGDYRLVNIMRHQGLIVASAQRHARDRTLHLPRYAPERISPLRWARSDVPQPPLG